MVEYAFQAHNLLRYAEVFIYRLVTRNSVEESMINRVKSKMMLEHVVVRRMADGKGSDGLKQNELDAILRHGAEELFADEDRPSSPH